MHEDLFQRLAIGQNLLFDVQPWEENELVSDKLPYLGLFQWSLQEGHVGLLKLLLQPSKGPGIGTYYRLATQNDDLQVLRHACQKGHMNLLHFLVLSELVSRASLENECLLIEVIYGKQDDALDFLLENGANPNDRNHRPLSGRWFA